MKFVRNIFLTFAMCTGLATAAWAQMGMNMPNIPGEFKPVVGAGAQYEMTTKAGKMNVVLAVVGKESVDGADGYWLETRMLDGKGAGTVMKQLMVMGGDKAGIKRMIMQMAGRPPMEMPTGMMMNMAKNVPKSQPGGAAGGRGEKVGTETVTVPAGVFVCDHYHSQSSGGATDAWASTKVSPYGLVKMNSDTDSMILEKTLTGETSQIKGEPQKMSFPGMSK
jgi:hypothetical protein